MAEIHLRNACVEIPVFDYSAQKLLKAFRFGKREVDTDQAIRSVTAIRDLTLEIASGDRLGIIGPNGAGKSTLLRLLSGVYAPTSGSIRRVGGISSLLDLSFGIEPDLTGRESIELRGKILGIPKKVLSEASDEIIEFSGLGHFIDLPTRTYSSGMFIRLAFSIVTALRPEILIMDEWLSVGDEAFRSKAESRLAHLVSQTEILVLASHSRELIEKSCTKVLYLEKGSPVALGSPDEVCNLYFEKR